MKLESWSVLDVRLCILFFLAILAYGAGDLSNQKHKTIKAQQHLNDLQCYTCHTMDTNASYCMNVSDYTIITNITSKCSEEEKLCMVKRISFTTSTGNSTSQHKVWSLERYCTKKCEPGCLVIGERLKVYKCTSCCDSSLCNADNKSYDTAASKFHILQLVFMLTLLVLCNS